jgi:dienelactone hydrolase
VDVQIPTPDGHSNGTLHVPDGDGVLVFPDASGARETIRQMGDRLAGMGHVALIPDIYHRAGQWAPFDVATLFTDELLLITGCPKAHNHGQNAPRVSHPNPPPPQQNHAPQPAAANPPAARTGSSTWH